MVASTAITLLVSIATGVQADVRKQVEDIGVNVLIVIPGRIADGTFNPNLGGMSYLTEGDATSLRNVEGVVATVPWTFVGGGIERNGKFANPILAATEPAWFAMRPTELEAGRLLQEGDRDVVVIGSIARRQLFGEESAIGQTVRINQRKYTVVGVTKDRESEQSLFSAGGLQNLVYLPYDYLKEITPDLQTHRIMVQIRPDVPPKPLIEQLEGVLGQRLDRTQYQVLTQEDLLGLVFKLMSILTWLLTGLTSIALFVGGVGILTVMLMSVNERSREIGIRKATGARRSDVFQQFLAEAILISVTGGVVGLLLSAGVGWALASFTPVKPMITPGIVGLAMSVCVGVGVIFGLIPAMNAAKKHPVEALRSE